MLEMKHTVVKHTTIVAKDKTKIAAEKTKGNSTARNKRSFAEPQKKKLKIIKNYLGKSTKIQDIYLSS